MLLGSISKLSNTEQLFPKELKKKNGRIIASLINYCIYIHIYNIYILLVDIFQTILFLAVPRVMDFRCFYL